MTRTPGPARPPMVARSTPETISQALTWDRNNARYRDAGWCTTCAAQAAWGHQLGFTHTNPPCDACTGLPVPATAGARAARWAGEPTQATAATEHPDRARADATITCPGCEHTWTAAGAAHCTSCHDAPFASVRLFDAHRTATGEHNSCRPPAEITNRAGERIMFLRDGMWRGPEMTDEQKLTRFGDRAS